MLVYFFSFSCFVISIVKHPGPWQVLLNSSAFLWLQPSWYYRFQVNCYFRSLGAIFDLWPLIIGLWHWYCTYVKVSLGCDNCRSKVPDWDFECDLCRTAIIASKTNFYIRTVPVSRVDYQESKVEYRPQVMKKAIDLESVVAAGQWHPFDYICFTGCKNWSGATPLSGERLYVHNKWWSQQREGQRNCPQMRPGQIEITWYSPMEELWVKKG